LNRTISTGQRQAYTTKIKDIVNKDIAYNWTLEGVAEQLSMSVSTLQRKLNNENICFREIMSNIKMNFAKNKLATTIDTIDDIAHNLGYSDASNFCAAFKRVEIFHRLSIEKKQRPHSYDNPISRRHKPPKLGSQLIKPMIL